MDPFEELQRMATNVENEPNDEISEGEVERWMWLFGYSYEQAVKIIGHHNLDFTRTRLTDSQWEMTRTDLESQGHNRSSWEHELTLSSNRPKPVVLTSLKITAQEARQFYLLKLEEPLGTSESVKTLTNLTEVPKCVPGTGDNGNNAQFCIINGSSKRKISEWISSNAQFFKPTFIPFKIAHKNLSSDSCYPTLGLDSTLPQYRASDNDTDFEPRQDQYPVWYFFYGTLAQQDILSRQLGYEDKETLVLYPASVSGGRIESWGGKYKALVDGSPSENERQALVCGSAFEVTSKEQEDALRIYETECYEVVRCSISIERNGGRRVVKGCTFRFVGTVDGE